MSTKGMLQRCWEHDYCAPSFYMITVVTEPRRGCLSVLNPEADGSRARLVLSPLGEIVRAVWRRASSVYPGVEACECVLMPDHFHGILWVKERLSRHMGHIVKAFKRVSEKECRSRGLLLPPNPSRGLLLPPNPSRGLLLPPNPSRGLLLPPNAGSMSAAAPAEGSMSAAAPAEGSVSAAAPAAETQTLWQKGFQDSILLRKGQLKAMVNYIADNPRRLAVKLAHPDLFTVVADHTVAPGFTCPVIGNRDLLRHPLRRQVQVSRRVSPRQLAATKEELLYAAEHGAVLLSPCISPGEKEIARAAMDSGRPLIVLLADGFPSLYKPPRRYFEACAGGRLLMIAPFPYRRQKHTITREQCLTLNMWAQTIVESATTAD